MDVILVILLLLPICLFGLGWGIIFLYWFFKNYLLRPKKVSDAARLEKLKKERAGFNEGVQQMLTNVQGWGTRFNPPVEKKPPSPPRVEIEIKTNDDSLSMGLKKTKKRLKKFDKKRKKKKR